MDNVPQLCIVGWTIIIALTGLMIYSCATILKGNLMIQRLYIRISRDAYIHEATSQGISVIPGDVDSFVSSKL